MATGDYITLADLKNRLFRNTKYVATTLSFTAATKTIADSALGLVSFPTGARIQISGSASNNGYFTIATGGVAGSIVVNEALVNEAAGASVTIADVSDVTDDSILSAVITAVSRKIDDHCDRFFYQQTGQVHYYSAEFPDVLVVDDLLTVSEIACDVSGNRTYAQIWDTSDYDLEPYNAAQESQPRPYTKIHRAPFGKYIFPIAFRGGGLYKVGIRKGVRITGNWGWPSVPAVVTEACFLQCERLFKRKDAPFGVMGAGGMGQLQVIPDLDPDVKWLLEDVRRRGGIRAA